MLHPLLGHNLQMWHKRCRYGGRYLGVCRVVGATRQLIYQLTYATTPPLLPRSHRPPIRASAETRAAREEAARAEQRAARAKEQTAKANQRLDEILARLSRVEQGASSAPSALAPPPPPSGHRHADYENEFDPNFTMCG